jgi:cystathionine beta-lyase/cystathionine gamma-synthase
MGGAVIGRVELIDAMRSDVAILGPTLDPHAAFLLQRGMKTYFVRWEAQCRNALRVAEQLARHPRVERVRYPGLPGDPGHALALRQMPDFGTIVTIDVAGGEKAGSRFAEQLELFSIAASLGSTDSLVVPPALQDASRLTAEQQRWADIGPGTVRLSIGLEDVDDLIADLESALG